jgi:3-phosphoshikimate 1-carboxyvinyltransferase
MKFNARSYSGQLIAPASKSHGQRLLILSQLAAQHCQIDNLGTDRDTQAMKNALEILRNHENCAQRALINVGESGFALRTLAFMARCFSPAYQLTGSGTLLQRTHWATIHLLEQLGLDLVHQDGRLPIEVSGEITNTRLEVDGTEGSQYVSGLFLMAAKHPGNWHITIKNLNSVAYFEMTLAALSQFGFVFERNGTTYTFEGGQELSCPKAQVEGDWSSVAAHLVGAAIRGKINISGLQATCLQPDQNLLKALSDFGANYTWENDNLVLSESNAKKPFDFDCTHQPDLFPVLVVLACAATGTSTLRGIQRLQNKESDRLSVMSEALTAWGISYQIKGEQIEIHGKGKISSAEINTHHDHRIVMACCVASLLSPDGQTLDAVEAVDKSYPEFVADFFRLTQA